MHSPPRVESDPIPIPQVSPRIGVRIHDDSLIIDRVQVAKNVTVPMLRPEYFFSLLTIAPHSSTEREGEYKVFLKCVACSSPRDPLDDPTMTITYNDKYMGWFCKNCAALWRINWGIQAKQLAHQVDIHLPYLLVDEHPDSSVSKKINVEQRKIVHGKRRPKVCRELFPSLP